MTLLRKYLPEVESTGIENADTRCKEIVTFVDGAFGIHSSSVLAGIFVTASSAFRFHLWTQDFLGWEPAFVAHVAKAIPDLEAEKRLSLLARTPSDVQDSVVLEVSDSLRQIEPVKVFPVLHDVLLFLRDDANRLGAETVLAVKELVELQDTSKRFDLWINALINWEVAFINEISQKWCNLTETGRKDLLVRIPALELSPAIDSLVLLLCDKPLQDGLNLLKEMLSLSLKLGEETHRVAVDRVNVCAPPLFRVLLWIEQCIPACTFDAISEVCAILSHEQQQLCFKLLFHTIRNRELHYNADDIRSLNWTDISTRIIAKSMDALERNCGIGDQQIYDVILDSIQDPQQALEITGYFECCEGRGWWRDNPNDSLKVERNKVPRGIKFCEGRLFTNKKGEPVLEPKNKKPFWTCHNHNCVQNCVNETLPQNWQDYSLLHCLIISGKPYVLQQYQILLGTLNRINAHLEHMKCRTCGSVLHPTNSSHFAFHRVTRFTCRKDTCEFEDEVYISHCLNRACSDVVDSRDCAKCKPDGHSQERCGWYICRYCLACCSTIKIKKRVEIYQNRQMNYFCHTKGHDILEDVCCPDCGTVFATEGEEDSTKIAIAWFEERKNKSHVIYKYGRRNDGGRWYLVKQDPFGAEDFREFLKNQVVAGLSVPDLDSGKTLQLVAEPFKESKLVLTCGECGFTLDVGQIEMEHDYDRLDALRYHAIVKKVFPKPKG